MIKIKMFLYAMIILLVSEQAYAWRFRSHVGGGCANSVVAPRLRTVQPCGSGTVYNITRSTTGGGFAICRFYQSFPSAGYSEWKCLKPAQFVYGAGIEEVSRYSGFPPSEPAPWYFPNNTTVSTNWGTYWTRDSDGFVRLRPWVGTASQLWDRVQL